MWEADQPDHVESIDGFEPRKLDALLAHRSQFRSTMHINGVDERAAFEARMHHRHAAAGLAAAEAFKAIRDL